MTKNFRQKINIVLYSIIMKYSSSDIENNIFKQNISGFHCGTPINTLLQEQAATFQHGRFVVPKQHERFQDLIAPNGLLIKNEAMIQKGGGLTIKEINDNVIKHDIFDNMLNDVCLKKKKNTSKKNKKTIKNRSFKLFS